MLRPAYRLVLARIGASLVEVHVVSALGEEHGEQAADEPAADDGDVLPLMLRS